MTLQPGGFSRHFLSLCSLTLLVCTGTCGTAKGTILLNNGAVNPINSISEDLEVSNGPGDATTVANVSAGADIGVNMDDRSIALSGSSILLFWGGSAQGDLVSQDMATTFLIGTASVGGDVMIGGNSQFQMSSSASVDGEIFIEEDATAAIFGGTPNDHVNVLGNAHLELNGGELGDELFVEDNATATLNGGYIDDDLNAGDDSVIEVDFVEVDDGVDLSGNGIVNFHDGIVNGSFEAAGNSTLNIMGGTFENIFSDGEGILASGSMVNVTGGTFGVAGVDEGGAVTAGFGSTVNFSGAEIAGVAEGIAPTASYAANLNGTLNLYDVEFGDLVLEAGSNGQVHASSFSADVVNVSTISGGVVNINATAADELAVFAELESRVNVSGGTFGNADLEAQSGSVITVRGSDFIVNGQPADFGDIPFVAGSLEGILADGSLFTGTFRRQFTPVADAGQIRLLPVPEPATAVMFLAASQILCLMRPRSRRLN